MDTIINNQKLEEAKVVFKLNVELFPNNANVFDSYAESLMMAGDFKNAIIFYNKSIQLNPENTNAKQMIERIGIEQKK